MKAHASAICSKGGSILNVGFGLGLVDEVNFRYPGLCTCCTTSCTLTCPIMLAFCIENLANRCVFWMHACWVNSVGHLSFV